MSKSQWCVITGAPSSGKTTIIQHLAKAGYNTTLETARLIIDEGVARGETVEKIRVNEAKFQQYVTARQRSVEVLLPLDEVVFLDRALPDGIAYCRLAGHNLHEAILACQKNLYRKVFLLEPLAFIKDYARTEDFEIMASLHSFIQEAYLDLDYEVTLVPVMPAKDRLHFILDQI